MIIEIFRDIDGFEKYYSVSNLGNVKSKKRDIILKPLLGTMGYLYVNLYKNKIGKHYFIHRLVCQSFHDNPLNKKCVNHLDGDRLNNVFYNLEWATYSENNMHAYRVLGRKTNGRKVAKIDNHNNVIEIYRSAREAGRKNNVTHGNISQVCRGVRIKCKGVRYKYI